MRRLSLVIFILFVTGFIGANAQYEVWFAKADKAMQAKDYEQAIEYFTNAINLNPNAKDAFYYRGLCCLYTRKSKEAVYDFTKTIELDSNHADAYNNRGLVYSYTSQFDLAMEDFNSALKIDTKFPQAYLNRSSGYLVKGVLDSAMMDIEQCIKYDVKNPDAYYQRGSINYRMGNYNRAIDDYNRSLKMGMKTTQLFYARGNAFFKLEDYKKALQDYDKVLAIDSVNFSAINNRIIILEKMGKTKEAEKERWRLVKLSDETGELIPLADVKFKTYESPRGNFSIEMPEKWIELTDTSAGADLINISKERIYTIADSYNTGARLVYNDGMNKLYKLKNRDAIMKFYEYSDSLNNREVFYHEVLSKEDFSIGDYKGYIKKVTIQLMPEYAPFRIYSIVLIKDDVLFFANFQAMEIQFLYFDNIFQRAIKSIKLK